MVFRSFSKLHPNGPVPHQISPPNSRVINPVRAFLAFTYLSKHTLGEAPPPDTADHHFWPEPPSQKTCLFNLVAGESHPSRLRASISSLVTASASRLPNFTFPSLPVRQWVLISHRTPVRAPRPDILIFSTPRPARLTHPDREYFPPVGCWREPPGHTTCLSVFTCPTQRVLISRWTPARAPRPDNLTFQTCCSTRLTRPTRRFWNQSDVGESLRDKQPYLFKPTARPGLPVRHGDSETSRTSARASGTGNFPFPSCRRQGLPNHAAGWLRGLPTP